MRTPDRGPRALHYAGVAGALFALFLAVAWNRLVDGDEGFYLVAARMIREGLRPYGDFFYLQMPVLPYALAGWLEAAGGGWHSARVLAALLATGLGVLVFHDVALRTRDGFSAFLAAALFATSGLALGWFSAVKTYGLCEILLFAGYLFARSERKRAILFCGLCLGLATSVRLYLVVAVPCVALHVLRCSGGSRASARRVAELALGFALGLAPCLPFLVRDRAAFVFDTWTFHSLRYPEGGESWFGSFGQKVETILGVLGIRGAEGPGGVQFLLLLAAGCAAAFVRGPARNPLALSLWIVLGATSLLPNPTFQQYFCLLVPFLAAGVAEAFGPRIRARPAIVALVAGYAGLGLWDAARFVSTGVRVPGIETASEASNFRIARIEEIGRAIDRADAPSGAGWWPGYFAFTRTGIVPEMANDFSHRAASKLSPEERRLYRIPSGEDVARSIRAGSPPVFVEGIGAPDGVGGFLQASGYRLLESVGPTRIWRWDPPAR